MIIYIIGFMGSGKSTTARQLGKKLHYNVVDLDRYIEEREGQSINELFDRRGEAAFRELERVALREVSTSSGNTVISVGGGTPCYSGNMEYMNQSGATLYLRHSPEQLAARLAVSRNPRPLLRGLSAEELTQFVEEKLAQREEYYNQCSIVADNPTRNVSSIVEILRMHPNF
ncbi:MAG: shikimate kinase [Rikenellaceae bacterium]